MIVSREYVIALLKELGDGTALYSVIQPSLVNQDADRSTRAFIAKFITKLLKWHTGFERGVLSDLYRWSVNQKLDHLSRKVLQASVTPFLTDELLFVIAELINGKFKGTSSPQPDWDSWYAFPTYDRAHLELILTIA